MSDTGSASSKHMGTYPGTIAKPFLISVRDAAYAASKIFRVIPRMTKLWRTRDKCLRHVCDIALEETGPHPEESHKLLEDAGFSIRWFEERLFGPRMVDPTSQPKRRSFDRVASYLATKDYKRAKSSFFAPGWQSLKYGRRVAGGWH